MNVLSIRNLSKSFGQQQIIKDLNMSVPEGSVFGFIGQNGAGKTTTMKRLSAESAVHCSQTFRHGFQTFGSILKWSAVGSKTLQTHFRLPMP